jgi:flagellum-specific ATP synthase
MSGIATKEQKEAAGQLRNMMSIYKENEDLISIGAYKQGNNPELDRAISHMPKINEFLQQKVEEPCRFEDTLNLLQLAVK